MGSMLHKAQYLYLLFKKLKAWREYHNYKQLQSNIKSIIKVPSQSYMFRQEERKEHYPDYPETSCNR